MEPTNEAPRDQQGDRHEKVPDTAWLLVVRAVQFVFAAIILGLTAYAADYFNVHTTIRIGSFFYGVSSHSPSRINYSVFTSVWTLMVLVYLSLVPLVARHKYHHYSVFGVDAVTTIFWFAAWIALAVFVGDNIGSCSATVCRSLKAAVVFGALEWLLFVVSSVTTGIVAARSRHGDGTEAAASNAAPEPSMEQRAPEMQMPGV